MTKDALLKIRDIITGWTSIIIRRKDTAYELARLAECEACPAKRRNFCSSCGCYIPAKVRVKYHTNRCPNDNWIGYGLDGMEEVVEKAIYSSLSEYPKDIKSLFNYSTKRTLYGYTIVEIKAYLQENLINKNKYSDAYKARVYRNILFLCKAIRLKKIKGYESIFEK